MGRVVHSALLAISALCALLLLAYLSLMLFVLLKHGGAYTYEGGDVWPFFSVNIFPDDDWPRALLLLFGLPLALLVASARLAFHAARRLAPIKLP